MDPITRLERAVRLVQDSSDRDLTLTSVRILCLLQTTPGLHQEAIAEKVSISTAHCSLLLYALSDKRRKDVAGHGLIEAVVDEDNRRCRKMFLTAKGQMLMRKVKEALA